MNQYTKGLVAGFAATVVLSILMIMKAKMGVMPDFNVIAMLASKLGGKPILGWLAHVVIGLGYGVIYASLFSKIKLNNTVMRGVILGFAGWLAMMFIVMPIMGAGLFGLKLASGIMVTVMTLVLHLIFGVVLTSVYRKL